MRKDPARSRPGGQVRTPGLRVPRTAPSLRPSNGRSLGERPSPCPRWKRLSESSHCRRHSFSGGFPWDVFEKLTQVRIWNGASCTLGPAGGPTEVEATPPAPSATHVNGGEALLPSEALGRDDIASPSRAFLPKWAVEGWRVQVPAPTLGTCRVAGDRTSACSPRRSGHVRRTPS